MSCTTWLEPGDPAAITGVRYDVRSGKFAVEMKMPITRQACHRLTMTTASGSELVARFRAT